VELDFPIDDNKLLRDNIGCFVAWRKRYIKFESESESSDHDTRESPERDYLLHQCLKGNQARHVKGSKVHQVRCLKGSKLLLALRKKAIVIKNAEVIISKAIFRTGKKARGTM
jgi:hypothetical protein